MAEKKTMLHCFNCDRPENELPLINLRYSGQPVWICPLCMPNLIHDPDSVSGKLPSKSK